MKNSVPIKQSDAPMPVYPGRDHDYTCTRPLRQSHQMACDGHFQADPKLGMVHTDDDDMFPPPPDFKVREHIYESPRFPIQEMSFKGAKTQSADGIARKAETEEGKSNRTN